MDRNQTLDTAKAAVNRAPKSYGNPLEHFNRVARHWNAHLDGITLAPDLHHRELTATDVAIMLGLVKIARLEHDPQHADSWCDLAGYAACGAEVSEPAVDYKVTIDTTPLSYWTNRSWYGAPLYTDDMDADRKPTVKWSTLQDPHRFSPVSWPPQYPSTPKQEPAWKRAKVGDRIRIREGARSRYNNTLPLIAIVDPPDDVSLCLTIHADGGHGIYVRHKDVLEILPPLPESKFGFTVGETVNMDYCLPGDYPGTIMGFSPTHIHVRWNHWGKDDPAYTARLPHQLRHGA